MENYRNEEFISFKLNAILSSIMKSHAIPLNPAQVMNHPFLQGIHAVYGPHPLVT